jgi:Peptidase family M28
MLILSVLLAMAQLIPPAVIPGNAPATVFSADRAMNHLEVIASQARPAGSSGHIAAREYLIREIKALGLQPDVQTTTVVQRWQGATRFEVGTVHNVLVRLPGIASTGAIALDGHYDSGSTGSGAADCGACVVALLETLRALRSSPPLQNDVIFVFSDAEENSDLGARAFVTQHPWAKDVRLALNFEATGNKGASILYSTCPNNLPVISGFVKAVPHPVASSFASGFLQLFPQFRGGCDLEEYMDQGIAGLGFAFAGNTTGYHTRLDNVQAIDRRSLQHHGSYALSLARYFGNQDLNTLQSTQGAIYFTILPHWIAYYSSFWVMPFAIGVSLLYLSIVVLGVRRRQLSLKGLTVGAIAFGFSAIASVILGALLWCSIKILNSNLQVFMVGHYQTPLYFLGLGFFTLTLMVLFDIGLRRRVGLVDRMAGALLIWTLLMFLTSVAMPGASYLFTFPLLFNELLLGWIILDQRLHFGSWTYVITLALAAMPGIFLLLPAMLYPNLAWMFRLEAFSPLPFLALALAFIALLMGLLIPQVDFLTHASDRHSNHSLSHRSRWYLPGTLALVSLLILSSATITSGFDTHHPRPNRIAYELNADAGKATWVSADTQLDSWTAQFFPNSIARSPHESFPGEQVQAFTSPAPVVSIAAPEVKLISDTTNNNVRYLRLQLRSPRQAINAQMQIVARGEITSATINRQIVDLSMFPLE